MNWRAYVFINLHSYSSGSCSAQISLDVANERKQEGNDLFRVGRWEEAITAYRSALGCLPKRTLSTSEPPPPADSDPLSDSDDGATDREGEGSKTKADVNGTDEKREEVTEVVSPAIEKSEKEQMKLRAVLNANIGASYLKMVRLVQTLTKLETPAEFTPFEGKPQRCRRIVHSRSDSKIRCPSFFN